MAFVALLILASSNHLPAVAAQTEDPGVHRGLPERAACGRTALVTLDIVPPEGTTSWLLVEHPPAELNVSEVDPANGGSYDPEAHRIDWVSTSGAAARPSYRVAVPENVTDSISYTFRGEFRFYPSMTERAEVTGRVGLTVDCVDEGDEVVPGNVVRELPAAAECGGTFKVRLLVDPGVGAVAWSVDEAPPVGASVSGATATHNGNYNEATHRVKWLALKPTAAGLVYNVTLSKDSGDEARFSGTFMSLPGMDNATEIGGDSVVPVDCFAWSDLVLPLAVVPLLVIGGVLFVRRRGNPPLP